MNDRQDHDQQFKTLLKEFIDSFFEIFFAQYARCFDFSRVEWLENEAFPDPPQGRRRVLDIVGRLPLAPEFRLAPNDPGERITILHIEVESSDSTTELRKSMFQYFAQLRQKDTAPILPIAVYLKVGFDGVDSYVETLAFTEATGETIEPLEIVRYNYWYIGLPALDSITYLHHPRALAAALSALMKMPPEAAPRHKVDALQKIAASGENSYRRHLLSECVDAYIRFDNDPLGRAEFQELIQHNEYREAREMTTTFFDEGLEQGLERGLEQGLEQGVEQGRLSIAFSVIRSVFGNVPDGWEQRISQWDADQLTRLLRIVPTVKSPDDVDLQAIEKG